MAGVTKKSCKACGKLHPMNAMRCSCGARLIDAPVVMVEEVANASALPANETTPAPERWKCEHCHFEHNDKEADVCQLCEHPRDAPAGDNMLGKNDSKIIYVLRFPFGDVSFESRLAVGRDADFCGFSEKLQAFERVSRKHAILELDATSDLRVIDMGSTNGTYVNGLRVDQATRAVVRVGDEISFSKGLTCKLRTGD